MSSLEENTEINMAELKTVITLLFAVLATVEAKNPKGKSECPPCNIQLTETYGQWGKRILLAKGPSDGICSSNLEVPYVFFGKDFGLKNDACCCLHTGPQNVCRKNPKAQKGPVCPDYPGVGYNETFGPNFLKVGQCQKDAPFGCCRPGTYRFTFSPELNGLQRDTCVCVVYNKGYIINQTCL